MSEEIAEVRNALVEAVAARKLIEQKLAEAKKELATWQKRTKDAEQFNADREVSDKIRQLELLIAEFEADVMAQQDQENTLKKTIKRLENTVPVAPLPDLSNIDAADETIKRLEGKVIESEAYAELSDNNKDRKLEEEAKSLSLDQELEALKNTVKKKKTK